MYLKNKSELIDILKELVSYNSVYSNDFPPFGKENKKCLESALEIGDKMGFTTKNLDNYCGYMEIGSGKEIIGIIAHLDIVPAGEGWKLNPFVLTLKDGKLYGRGTSDDKGAVAASIMALKYLKNENHLLNKRIRLILGCNEENDSDCIKHYLKTEEKINYGFSPDVFFPCITGEKGVITGELICGKTNNIIDICGGTVPNVVCEKCKIILKEINFDIEKFKNFINENKLKYEINNNEITVYGNPTHASTPEYGKNAISYLLVGLKKAGFKDSFVDFYNNKIGLTYNGELYNCNVKDEFSNLTMNIGIIKIEDNEIKITFDIRFPITYKSKKIIEILKNEKVNNVEMKIISCTEPLHYSNDSKLVSKLMEAYQNVSKDYNAKPLIIGGSTYAKLFDNCIAYGCEIAGKNCNIHKANEYIELDHLVKQVDYYVEGIKKLLEI